MLEKPLAWKAGFVGKKKWLGLDLKCVVAPNRPCVKCPPFGCLERVGTTKGESLNKGCPPVLKKCCVTAPG